jgi:coatomer protein complex subunit alpha (xenin)
MTSTMEAMFAAQWAGLEAAAKAAASKLPPLSPSQEEDDEMFEEAQSAAVPVVDTKAWNDDDLDAELEHVQLPVTVPVGAESSKPNTDVVAYGESRESRWLARRRMPVDLVACGEYVEALSVLQRRIALINAGPLKPLFQDIVMASHASVPGMPFAPSIETPISNAEGDGPGILFTVPFLRAKLGEVLHHTGFGNAGEALGAARYVIQALTLTLAKSSAEEEELFEILATAQKYAHAMLIETTRREISTDPKQKVREMELAAYLCCEKLEPIHMLLVTDLAMKMAFKGKCFVHASQLAKRIITGTWGSSDEFVTASTTRARKVIIASEEKGTDELKINFDPSWLTTADGLKLCSGSLAPVPAQLHEKMICCPLCKSGFHPDWQGQVCSVCQLSQVGATAMGLQFLPI